MTSVSVICEAAIESNPELLKETIIIIIKIIIIIIIIITIIIIIIIIITCQLNKIYVSFVFLFFFLILKLCHNSVVDQRVERVKQKTSC